MFSFPSNINIKICSKNQIEAITSEGLVVRGTNVGSVLKSIALHYSEIDEHKASQHHNGFTVGQSVVIKPQKRQKIVDASGVVEGFPETITDKIGTIESFDIYTMSSLNVYINIDGVLYRGSTQDIKMV